MIHRGVVEFSEDMRGYKIWVLANFVHLMCLGGGSSHKDISLDNIHEK